MFAQKKSQQMLTLFLLFCFCPLPFEIDIDCRVISLQKPEYIKKHSVICLYQLGEISFDPLLQSSALCIHLLKRRAAEPVLAAGIGSPLQIQASSVPVRC